MKKKPVITHIPHLVKYGITFFFLAPSSFSLYFAFLLFHANFFLPRTTALTEQKTRSKPIKQINSVIEKMYLKLYPRAARRYRVFRGHYPDTRLTIFCFFFSFVIFSFFFLIDRRNTTATTVVTADTTIACGDWSARNDSGDPSENSIGLQEFIQKRFDIPLVSFSNRNDCP